MVNFLMWALLLLVEVGLVAVGVAGVHEQWATDRLMGVLWAVEVATAAGAAVWILGDGVREFLLEEWL